LYCTGYKGSNEANETLQHKIQNQYNKLNTQTITSHYKKYIRLFFTGRRLSPPGTEATAGEIFWFQIKLEIAVVANGK